jgi:hypothetical protein
LTTTLFNAITASALADLPSLEVPQLQIPANVTMEEFIGLPEDLFV